VNGDDDDSDKVIFVFSVTQQTVPLSFDNNQAFVSVSRGQRWRTCIRIRFTVSWQRDIT
jgi:hypothetical protein